jgi:hypothetical protein
MATKKTKTPISVEALKHPEATRKNIPTAEYQAVLAKAEQPKFRSLPCKYMILLRTKWRLWHNSVVGRGFCADGGEEFLLDGVGRIGASQGLVTCFDLMALDGL